MDGVRDGVLRARVAAPPVGDEANRALIRLLAQELAAPAGAVRIVSGERSRIKRVAVVGMSPERLTARWPGLTV